ncbi:dihydrouridine synthase (Dus) [Novymonas esmeraldas]|uniref:tRNA-dihydrouridine(16/17) synthase [NAD(P)(+)] n=1 Tax=Novymonas esmeraldas TaxID=1808958 RepID=A0AAW0EVC0_9TRYP
MAYHQKRLDAYRQLIAEGKPFRCATCPYCNGTRDATVQHIHPSTKPATPSAFWEDVLVRKYAAVQSHAARANMTTNTTDAAGGSRMCVVGPMVDQSELPFRMLCRQYGAALAYTPMLHAKSFAEGAVYRAHFLTTSPPAEVAAAMVASAAHTSTQKTGGDLADGGGLDGGSGAGEGEANAVADAALVDRPCIVQFCGHDADTVLRAARFAVLGEQAAKLPDRGGDSSTPAPAPAAAAAGGDAEYPVHVRVGGAGCETEHRLYQCDAVDLNLGCPQGIARRGHYGSFLMEDWDLVHTIIHTLHVELEVPVTVKIRVFDHPGHTDADGPSTHRGGRAGDEEEEDAAAAVAAAADEEAGWEQRKEDFDEALTVLYACMIRDAGAQVLCIHGRTREMKGQQTGLANMDLIRRVREALGGSIPVISNGNVRTFDDVVRHLADTRCEGHMCAEPLLWDPRLFSRPARPVMPGRTHGADKLTRLAALHTALVYMQWVRRYPVDMGFVKAHLFKMCFHSYELHTGFRETLAQLKTSAATLKELERGDASEAMQSMQGRVAASCSSGGGGGCAAVEDEESAAVAAATAAASVTASAFALYVDAIEAHLRALVEAERRCVVEGEQPKAAQMEKAKAKETVVDVWAEEGGLGIDF